MPPQRVSDVQVAPEIDRNFKNAYSIWKNAAKVLQSENDEVATRYKESVELWLRDYKTTLLELGNAPLKTRHWDRIWMGCMNKPYVQGFKLDDLIRCNAFEHKEAISEITGVASGEYALELQLEKVTHPSSSAQRHAIRAETNRSESHWATHSATSRLRRTCTPLRVRRWYEAGPRRNSR